VDGALQAEAGQLRGLPGRRPEAGAPQQARGLLLAEGTLVDGNPHREFLGIRGADLK
jgi:hypothetical protein